MPAGLTLYWFVNNILSTSQQLYLKSTTKVNIPEVAVASTMQSTGTIVKPKEERVKKVTGEGMQALPGGRVAEPPAQERPCFVAGF